MRLLRIVLLAAIAVTLLVTLVAIGSGTTGALEKLVLAAWAALLVAGAARVRRLGVEAS
jgi:hypothetical protein